MAASDAKITDPMILSVKPGRKKYEQRLDD